VAAAAYAGWVTVFTIWPDDVQWRPLSPRLFWLQSVSLAIGLAVAGAIVLVGWYVVDFWVVWSIGGLIGLLILLRFVLLRRSLRSWGYAERVDDLLVRRGLLYRRLSIVPYGRMQFVDVTAGPLERMFGLATVQLHTAAAASDASIPGLPPQEAARLRDRLASLGEGRAEGLCPSRRRPVRRPPSRLPPSRRPTVRPGRPVRRLPVRPVLPGRPLLRASPALLVSPSSRGVDCTH
jgi:uncharacterized protein